VGAKPSQRATGGVSEPLAVCARRLDPRRQRPTDRRRASIAKHANRNAAARVVGRHDGAPPPPPPALALALEALLGAALPLPFLGFDTLDRLALGLFTLLVPLGGVRVC
jgi:hypothetical protein